MSKLRLLCSRVLHHHHWQQQRVIPCSFGLSRNYRSSYSPRRYDDDDDEDDDGISSRLDSLYATFHGRVLALRDERIKNSQSTDLTDNHLARLERMQPPADEKDVDFLDDDTDDDELYEQEAHRKEDRQRKNMMDQFNKLRLSYNKHIQNGGDPMEAYEYLKKMLELKKKITIPRMEYVIIKELIDRLKVAEDKDKFILQMKLNRAVRIVRCRERFDPHNPINYGVIENAQNQFADVEDDDDRVKDDEDEEYDDMREKDTVLLAKLSELDKQLEHKLAELEHTFGKKGKLLEEEIKDLAEERNSLTEMKGQPLYRKGFDVKLIDVNRTCKVTKGGQIAKYTVMLACGNYNGAVGFAKAKGLAVPIALQKAREKCFQNLHYIERHEEHTIAHAINVSYKKTKVYLWPAPAQTGVKAGRIVQTILNLAGFKNVKSKVIGSRNPHNTVKAVFKALNAIETPKDIQEKFGRTVVESYLL